MAGLPIADAELRDEHGHPNRFTHLEPASWHRVYDFFGGVVPGELYIAILYLRLMASYWNNPHRLKELASRSNLINPLFFDLEIYNAKSVNVRLAAAISWAIATYFDRDPESASSDHRAVAFCLASPMRGGELEYS